MLELSQETNGQMSLFGKEIILTDEQEEFIRTALTGVNVLVDACIGSGKTTAIQKLCDRIPEDKEILYLTYNKLLKVDAKEKIKNKNTFVANYHGFAFNVLASMGIKCAVPDLIQTFMRVKPEIRHFDILILDEYQDIDTEISRLLRYIKAKNPGIQIVAVGDMCQKIYDKTSLDPQLFINDFLEDFETIDFTKCFRLNKDHAEMLGRIWGKEINGVNENCQVLYMNPLEVKGFLAAFEPKDILCLGIRDGQMAAVLNKLEEDYPQKFNKKTVYASIRESNKGSGGMEPKKSSAIFTTFDASKGMERKVCVVFDYTEEYFSSRVNKPNAKYAIIRNVFCVAASRGKEYIIFVDSGNEHILKDKYFSTIEMEKKPFGEVNVSEMFSFKYKEDIEDCYNLLDIREIPQKDKRVIKAKTRDELIDLSPCIGIYQEAMFFNNYDIDKAIDRYIITHGDIPIWKLNARYKYQSLEEKILYYTSLETSQDRYIRQVELPLVNENIKQEIEDRLGSVFSHNELEQIDCERTITNPSNRYEGFEAHGTADVIKDHTVYELKFVSELSHEYFLQCACYVVFLCFQRGILWNTKNNEMYEIRVPNVGKFMRQVAKTVTKGEYQ